MAKTSSKPSTSSFGSQLSIPKWTLPAAFCILALRVGALLYDRGFSSYDDGVAAEGARLILRGGIPYKDFWTMYAPAGHYVNALAMAILGERLISIRVFGLLCGALQAALLYAILSRTVRSAAATIVCATTYLALIPLGVQSHWFTMALVAVYALIRCVETPQSRWWYACGLFAALTLLFRQDTGAYLSIAIFPLIYVAAPGTGPQKLLPLLKALGVFIVVIAATITYFAAKGALVPMIDQTLRFAALEFPKARPLPYPTPWQEAHIIGKYSAPLSIAFFYQLYGFYLLPAVLIASSFFSIRQLLNDDFNRARFLAAALLCIALALYLMVRVRPSGGRIVAGAMLSTVAFAALTSDKSKLARIGAMAMLTMSIPAFVPIGAYTVWALRSYGQNKIAEKGGVRTARGHAEILSTVSARIRKLTGPSERILCGAPVIYFLSSRDPVTRYYEPHPGVTNTPKVQRAIIHDIEKNHTRYFVRSCEWTLDSYFTIEPECEPKMLIDYIEKNYKVESDFALFQIYERKTPFSSLAAFQNK
ncbi:MAG: glycosyltransferase family 39 protein [Armatimonadetes bacterium]|nr:glycosyltransferase family 39 protein [Armatimonadota bacterium]